MVKVLYVSPNGYLGGAERFVLTAVKNHNSSTKIKAGILFFSEGEAYQEAKALGLTCYVLKTSFRLRNPLTLFKALLEIRKIVLELRPEVLHLTMPYSHIVLSLATIGLNIKKVWFQHGPVGGMLDRIANLFAVDMIWHNSNYLKQKHNQTWPKSSVRISQEVINLGVSIDVKSRQIFTDLPVKIGSAGRICYGKGFHNIIQALGELKKEDSTIPFRLSVAGVPNSLIDKQYACELTALVTNYNLVEEVTFLGHLNQMDEFYQGLDVFVHAAVYPEAFGLVVAEAMASGCLVAGSVDGGIKDLLGDGAFGMAFHSTDSDAVFRLKTILQEMMSNRDDQNILHLRSLAERGRNNVINNYTVNKMMEQLESLYLKLVDN